MNILPKKSWHVRTKANIERVRKDEENAANEEKERQRRIALAESEARTDKLRDRAHAKSLEEGDQALVKAEPSVTTGHVNFFQDIEDGQKQKKGNAEYEEEKKQEKEKQEKAIGLLTYLGQSAIEGKTSKPWYETTTREKQQLDQDNDVRSKVQEEFDRKKKLAMDPMATMMKYLAKQDKIKHKKEGKEDPSHKHHHHGHHHHDYKHKHHKHNSHSHTKPAPSGKKTMAELRAERLRREQEERQKTEKLLAKVRGEKLPEEKATEPLDDRDRRYNSQFNPELARKRKRRDDDGLST